MRLLRVSLAVLLPLFASPISAQTSYFDSSQTLTGSQQNLALEGNAIGDNLDIGESLNFSS